MFVSLCLKEKYLIFTKFPHFYILLVLILLSLTKKKKKKNQMKSKCLSRTCKIFQGHELAAAFLSAFLLLLVIFSSS